VDVLCQVEASAKGRSSSRRVLPSVYVSLYVTSCNSNPYTYSEEVEEVRLNKTGNVRNNVTLRRVRATIAAVEKH